MKEFFQKHGGKYGDPYEAIEIICHKLYEIKEKVAQGDPSHIKDLASISDMIDDYVNSIHDEDMKPIQRGAEYQDYQPQGGEQGMNNGFGGFYPMYPFYGNERQRNDGRDYERQRTEQPRNEYRRNSSIGYGTRDFGGNYPDDYPPYYNRGGSQHGGSTEVFSNRRR